MWSPQFRNSRCVPVFLHQCVKLLQYRGENRQNWPQKFQVWFSAKWHSSYRTECFRAPPIYGMWWCFLWHQQNHKTTGRPPNSLLEKPEKGNKARNSLKKGPFKKKLVRDVTRDLVVIRNHTDHKSQGHNTASRAWHRAKSWLLEGVISPKEKGWCSYLMRHQQIFGYSNLFQQKAREDSVF